MTAATRTTLLAALAVVLAASALTPLFADASWVPPVVAGVGAVAGGMLLARRLRVPLLLQPLLAVPLLTVLAGLLFARDTLVLGLPTPETVVRLGEVLGEGLLAVETERAPVPVVPGLVLLALLGVAAAALLVDALAVTARRPALAGLPLLAMLAVPSGFLPGGVGWWPFVLGATGWLLLLVDDAGTRVARWGTALRAGSRSGPLDDSSLGRTGRRVGVAALGLAVVVPALLPGMEARLLTGGTGSGFGGSRTVTTYNPITELGGQLRLPEPQPLLVYATNDPAPDYLRLTTLDRFDDASGWRASDLSADVRRDAVSGGIPVPTAVRSAPGQEVATRVRIQGLGGPWMPTPAVPTRVSVDGPWLWDRDSETVFSTRVDLQEVDAPYEVSVRKVVPDPARLRAADALPDDLAPFAEPPQVSPYVQQLTQEVVAGAETPYDQVAALQAFFRDADNGFTYSEDADVPSIDAPNALEAFLRGRQGFCEQYASAMAAMARVLGLPARVAVGFTPGSPIGEGQYQVTTNDAHAWPEVWFEEGGWVRFEPTPRAEQVTTPDYTVPPAPEQEEVPEPAASSPAATPDATAPQPTAPAAPVDPEAAGGDDAAGALPGWLSPRRLLGAAVLAILLAGPALVAAARRRRRWREPGPQAAWAQVVEDAGDVGHRWNPADSPLAAAARLVEARGLGPDASAALTGIAADLERERYARPGSTPAADADRLRDAAAAVRAALLAGAPARTRWTARLLPASSLRWAADAGGQRVADVLDRVDGLVGAATARVRALGRGTA
ncbi:MAG TPA: DUF3488 and transglutaminase-like domain-containing protein [Mycobacteriales bacterium]|nr:DUF3488 and transglutaminase-like domain-containing protein [Mycobacteriales bacterium]